MSGSGVPHIQGSLFKSGLVVNWDTLFECWLVMGIILLLTWIATRSLKKQSLGKSQFICEALYELWESQVKSQITWKPTAFLPIVGAIFVFSLFGYWLGLMPWKLGLAAEWWPVLDNGHPFEGASPTSDMNITAGMAVVAIVTYLVAGSLSSGFSYWAPYFGVEIHHGKMSMSIASIVTAFVEWLDLILRPATLAIRLFANTFAGEALLVTIVKLTVFILPIPILIFEFGVGVLQAFIFAMLSTVYISIATSHGPLETSTDLDLDKGKVATASIH
ncbi:MAG TPA: FoF1 ATP synthase subunit a [Vampirovibrionales bacterium]